MYCGDIEDGYVAYFPVERDGCSDYTLCFFFFFIVFCCVSYSGWVLKFSVSDLLTLMMKDFSNLSVGSC